MSPKRQSARSKHCAKFVQWKADGGKASRARNAQVNIVSEGIVQASAMEGYTLTEVSVCWSSWSRKPRISCVFLFPTETVVEVSWWAEKHCLLPLERKAINEKLSKSTSRSFSGVGFVG
ncbi:hypothetical protein Plhal304r1_c006g0022991 [Plasmopara halstedii]